MALSSSSGSSINQRSKRVLAAGYAGISRSGSWVTPEIADDGSLKLQIERAGTRRVEAEESQYFTGDW
jgi:hypothetical protein